jgi:hypothetical protein
VLQREPSSAFDVQSEADSMDQAEILKKLTKLANDAVDVASKKNIKLDFTPASIAALESFCDQIYRENQISWFQKLRGKKPYSIDFPTSLLGAYLGETLRKQIGGLWENEEGEGWALVTDRGRCYPLNKVWKRLTNGDEDNLMLYFDGIMRHLK